MNTLLTAGFIPYFESTRASEKVLVVEDEPVWQLVIERALKLIDSSIKVRFSSDASHAFDLLSTEGDFDLVIADQRLNGARTGLDLWDILLQQNVEVPFVLLSAIKREAFIAGLMPYRDQMLPRYIEKRDSVKQLSREIEEAFFAGTSKPKTQPKTVDRTEKETLSQIMKKKYYWMV